MRIRGYDEQTEEYIGNIEELSGKIADLTKTASKPGGISLFTDANKTTYKSTYQLLKDISEIYDELTDKQQAGLLEALAGKRQGQIVAATITNFKAAEKALQNMANSAGSAEAELATYQESAEYLFNQFKETFTSIAQNAIKRDDLKNLIKAGTTILGIVDKIVSQIGLIPTILTTSVGIVASKKTLSHNFLGFNLNEKGNIGFNFLGAQVGSGWSAQRAAIKAQSAEYKTALNDLYTGMVNGEQESAKFQTAFTKAMSSNNVAVQTFAQKAKQGTATIQDMTAATTVLGGAGAKLKSILAGLGNAVLSMGISIGISALINGIISGIKAVATYNENLRQAVKECNEQVKSAEDEVKEYNSQLAEIRKQIYELEKKSQNGKLSFFDEDELKRLKDAEKTLDKLLRVMENEAQDKLDKAAQKAHKQFLSLNFGDTGIEGFGYTAAHSFQMFAKSVDKMDARGFKEVLDLYDVINNLPTDKIEEINEELERVFKTGDSYKLDILIDGELKDLFDFGFEKSLDDYIKKIKDKANENYNDWVEMYEALLRSSDAKHQEEAALLKTFIDRYEELSKKVYKSPTEVYESANFAKVVSKLEELAQVGELTGDIIREATDKDIEGIEAFKDAMVSVGETDFEHMAQSIIEKLKEQGKQVKETTKAFENYERQIAAVQERLEKFISSQENLNDAFKKLKLGGTLDDKELFSILNEFPKLADYLDETADGWTVSENGFIAISDQIAEDEKNRLKEVKTELEGYIETVGMLEALNREARASVDPSAIYNSEEYQKWYDKTEEIRKKLGINPTKGWSVMLNDFVTELNGVEFQIDLVDKMFNKHTVGLEGLKESYKDAESEISDFNSQIKTVDSAIEKLTEGSLLSYEELNELLAIDNTLQYDGSEKGYSIAVDALEEVRKKSYETRNSRIKDIIAIIEAEKSAAEASREEYQKTLADMSKTHLWEDAYKNFLAANAQIEYSCELINRLNGLMQDITYDDKNNLSNELQNRIDYYKNIISAIEIMRDKYSEAFEKEKEALENEKKALQDGKDALKEANDERQRELDLIEARNNLENAKKRKVWVYSEGNGFKQVQDKGAVKEAEEKYRDAITDIQEAEIDKKIAEIDKKIEANEKQQEAFEKSLEDMTKLEQNIEDAKTVEQAKTALGLADEKDLLNLSDAVKEGIKNGLAEAIIEKDNEDNKDNTYYKPADLNDVLKSLGATVTAEELKSMKSELPTEAVYNAAVKGFADSLKDFSKEAVQNVTNNNNGMVVSPTFNIYDASDPNKVAEVVNSEITNLLTRYNNSIK